MNIFRYDQNEVRTHEADGQAWFCLNDVARVLEIAQPKNFLSSEWCDKDGVRLTDLTDALGRVQQTTFINEGNLYTLVGRSRKAGAIAFTRWVNHEVLPTLRKTGAYVVSGGQADPILAQLEIIAAMRREQVQLESRVTRLELAQQEAAEAVLSLPAPSVGVRDLTLRERVRQAVDALVGTTGLGHQEVWRRLYRRYEYVERVNIEVRAKNKGLRKLEWIEAHGNMDRLYAIAMDCLDAREVA